MHKKLTRAYQLKATARVDRYCRRIEALAEKRDIPLKELQAEADKRSTITRARRRQRWEKEGKLLTNQDLFEMTSRAKSRNGNSAAFQQVLASPQTDSHADLELRYLRSCAARCRCNAGRTAVAHSSNSVQGQFAQGCRFFAQAARSVLSKILTLTSRFTFRK